jgi:hypothetical protein
MSDHNNLHLRHHAAGLAQGAAMTDDEVLRFANGVIAAINSPNILAVRSAVTARANLEAFIDLLAENGMVATVGYAGTAIIRALPSFIPVAAAA